jgi:hypothetical protein
VPIIKEFEMSRPKGSKNKTSKRIEVEETTFLGQGSDGPTPIKLVQEVERYTFKNLGPSRFYVTPKFKKGETKEIPPGISRDDITKRDREVILESELYRIGQVVEEIPEEIDEVINPNSLNDKQLNKLMLMDNDEIKGHIISMDSIFALNRVKERVIDKGLPAHLLGYIDSRIGELQVKYDEDHKAPIDSIPGGREI